jgi:hypothetical protein
MPIVLHIVGKEVQRYIDPSLEQRVFVHSILIVELPERINGKLE